MTMLRYKVAHHSMEPNLSAGDEFVATDSQLARRGDMVALLHPGKEDFWLVKRLVALEGDRADGSHTLEEGQAWVLSDNPGADVVDSRVFGPVPVASLHPIVTKLDSTTFAEGVHLLIEEDSQLKAIIDEFGMPGFWSRSPGFATLVLLILEQQVSLESGAAVFRRLIDRVGSVTPERIVSFSVAELNDIGITRQKAGYVLGLAEDVLAGRFGFDDLASMSPADGQAALLAIRGIGPWTAQAYLLSAERLPDLFPVGDRALQVGAGEALKMTTVPGPDELELLAEAWRPIRSVAARILWHGYLSRRGRREPESPISAHDR